MSDDSSSLHWFLNSQCTVCEMMTEVLDEHDMCGICADSAQDTEDYRAWVNRGG